MNPAIVRPQPPVAEARSEFAAHPPGNLVRELRREWGVDLPTAKILNEVSAYRGQRAEIVMRENRGIESVQTPAGVAVAAPPTPCSAL